LEILFHIKSVIVLDVFFNVCRNKKNICANFRGEKKILWVLEEIFDILNKSLIILMQAYASCTLRKNVL